MGVKVRCLHCMCLHVFIPFMCRHIPQIQICYYTVCEWVELFSIKQQQCQLDMLLLLLIVLAWLYFHYARYVGSIRNTYHLITDRFNEICDDFLKLVWPTEATVTKNPQISCVVLGAKTIKLIQLYNESTFANMCYHWSNQCLC